MTRPDLQSFFARWWQGIALGMFAVLMFRLALVANDIQRQTTSIVHQEQVIVGAKERLAVDRETIAQTREKVENIEQKLLSSKVPDRLERIEKSIGSAVIQNQKAIQGLDARQKAITDKLEMVLGIPREEIEAEGEPEKPRP